MSSLKQLPLAIGQREDRSFDNFVIGKNSEPGLNNLELVETLRQSKIPFIYVWGERGCGKSHLLQALSREINLQEGSAIYLPLSKIVEMGAQALSGLEVMELVVLDDLEVIAGQRDWEETLFGLYNQIRDAGSRIVVTAKSPPEELSLKLPDLHSRFQWGPIFQLQMLSDEEKLVALKQRALERGFEIPESTISYLLRHGSRDLHHLFKLLEELDNASLVEQRKLTIPFVKSYINRDLS
ncbi:MAG: DnaA regulatory inactivator Hda [Gammaproteobacteria bacterium]|nr:DnaA regulatory inactivator Hda [Gammaproteobacteria bacterium]